MVVSMLERIKARILSLFASGTGCFLQLLLLGFLFVPLQYLNFAWWIDALIGLVIILFKVLGGLVYVVVWIWSFIIFVQSPFTTYSIIYLVFLVLWLFISFILPRIIHKKKK